METVAVEASVKNEEISASFQVFFRVYEFNVIVSPTLAFHLDVRSLESALGSGKHRGVASAKVSSRRNS